MTLEETLEEEEIIIAVALEIRTNPRADIRINLIKVNGAAILNGKIREALMIVETVTDPRITLQKCPVVILDQWTTTTNHLL